MVAFEYIEGYYPQAYNLTRTLSSDESKNYFDFVYISTENTETVITQREDNVVTGGAGAGEGMANIGDNETPQAGPVEVVDLDDNQTPTANAPGTDATDIDGNKTPGVSWPVLGGGAVVILGIAAAAIALARRRGSEEEEE